MLSYADHLSNPMSNEQFDRYIDEGFDDITHFARDYDDEDYSNEADWERQYEAYLNRSEVETDCLA